MFPGAIHIVSHDVCVGDQYMLHDFKQVTTLSTLIFNTETHAVFDLCKCSKILYTFFFLFSNNMLVFRDGIHKMLIRKANREDLHQTGASGAV